MNKQKKSVSSIGEFGLINYIKKNNTVAKKQHNVCLDIGDDCFVFNSFKNSKYVVTTDILIEGTHFKAFFEELKKQYGAIGFEQVDVINESIFVYRFVF